MGPSIRSMKHFIFISPTPTPTQPTHGGQPLAQSLLKVFSPVQTKFFNPLDGSFKGADIKH